MSKGHNLADRVLLLATSLPLCDASELVRLAGAHPGAVRRVLGSLVSAGLLIAERHRLPAPTRMRWRPSGAGLARAASLMGLPARTVERRFGHAPGALTALRNRLEWITAARSVFIGLEAACREVGNGYVQLESWDVPSRQGLGLVDGVGRLVSSDGRRTVAVVVDRNRLAVDRLVPLARRVIAGISRHDGNSVVVLAGSDCRRLAALRSYVHSGTEAGAASPECPVVLAGEDAARAFIASFAHQTEALPTRSIRRPGTGGAHTPLQPGPGRMSDERRIAALRDKLTQSQIAVLDALADHAPSHVGIIAFAAGSSRAAAKRRLSGLINLGLVREVSERPRRCALTDHGLRLLAARDGWWSTSAYAHVRGAWFVGPGDRGIRGLRKVLAHNAGADAFVRLFARTGSCMQALGRGDGLHRWEGPGLCQRRFEFGGPMRRLRPDGLVGYVARGEMWLAHLEWDRGTMKHWQYARKLETYRAYVEAEAWRPDRDHLPALLFVFRHWHTEHRVMLLARLLVGDLHELVVLSTTTWRLTRFGPLAAVWRTLDDDRRVQWPGLERAGA